MADDLLPVRGGPLDGGAVRPRGPLFDSGIGVYRLGGLGYSFCGVGSRRCSGCGAFLIPEPGDPPAGACPLCGAEKAG